MRLFSPEASARVNRKFERPPAEGLPVSGWNWISKRMRYHKWIRTLGRRTARSACSSLNRRKIGRSPVNPPNCSGKYGLTNPINKRISPILRPLRTNRIKKDRDHVERDCPNDQDQEFFVTPVRFISPRKTYPPVQDQNEQSRDGQNHVHLVDRIS